MYKYITGIIQAHDLKLLAINGMPDHIHVFFGMRPVQSLSDLMPRPTERRSRGQDIKQDSSKCPPDGQGSMEKSSLRKSLNGPA